VSPDSHLQDPGDALAYDSTRSILFLHVRQTCIINFPTTRVLNLPLEHSLIHDPHKLEGPRNEKTKHCFKRTTRGYSAILDKKTLKIVQEYPGVEYFEKDDLVDPDLCMKPDEEPGGAFDVLYVGLAG
jgi:Peptidase inhibitor I9